MVNGHVIELKKPIPRMRGHVVVAVLAGDTLQTDTAAALGGMMLMTRTGALITVKNSLVPCGRNQAVAQAYELGGEWLLFLDSDMVFPTDTLVRLLSHGKDVVGGTYPKRVPPHNLLYKLLPGVDRVEQTQGLVEVAGLPGGCLLINMRVFDQLLKPYFQTPAFRVDDGNVVEAVTGAKPPRWLRDYITRERLPDLVGEDFFFCAAARHAGFQCWLDVEISQRLGHIGQQVWYPQTYEEESHGGPASVGIPKVG